MRKALALGLLGFGIGFWGGRAAAAPITYFLRQEFVLSSAQDCSAALDDLSKTLFGSKDQYRHLTLYSYLKCGPAAEPSLAAEVLFESSDVAEDQELESWIRTLTDWQGQPLGFRQVRSIFWNTYGLANKADGSLAASFEKPRVAFSFGQVLAAKVKMKSALQEADPAAMGLLLQEAVGPKEYARWRQEVLPQTAHLDLLVYTYFLTADGTAEKASPVYQMTRDCRRQKCDPGP